MTASPSTAKHPTRPDHPDHQTYADIESAALTLARESPHLFNTSSPHPTSRRLLGLVLIGNVLTWILVVVVCIIFGPF